MEPVVDMLDAILGNPKMTDTQRASIAGAFHGHVNTFTSSRKALRIILSERAPLESDSLTPKHANFVGALRADFEDHWKEIKKFAHLEEKEYILTVVVAPGRLSLIHI